MRAVIQRVSQAAVSIDGMPSASIGTGLLVLLGVEVGRHSYQHLVDQDT